MDGQFRVLLVDSNAAGRADVAHALHHAGYTVEAVHQPPRAFFDRPVDIVVLVVHPPSERELALLATLQRDAPSVPVLVIGPVTVRTHVAPRHCLIVPYTQHALLDRIASLIQGSADNSKALGERLMKRGLSSISIRELLESETERLTLAQRLDRLFDRTEGAGAPEPGGSPEPPSMSH
jgi:DNA-binding response OmpR family regulator